MLRVLTSRACGGKTTQILKKIKENIENKKLSYVMFPEQLTLEGERLFTAKMEIPLFLCKIMSFDRLSQEVLSKVGGSKKQYIDDICKVMLIENILMEHKEEFIFYKNSINKTGFLENIVDLLTQLKKYDISPNIIDEFASNCDDALLKTKLLEMSKMYMLLEEKTSEKFIDNEYRLGLLAEKIDEYVKIKDFEIFFDNFVSFTALEMNVIGQLLKNNIDITITLPYDNSGDSCFKLTEETLEDLIKTAKLYNQNYELIHLDKSYNENEELSYLEQNFGKSSIKPYDKPTNDISITTFDNALTEVTYVANKINNLVRNHNYRYLDISVAITEDVKYSRLIQEVFSKYDIPFFIDSKKDVSGENIISMVFSFLDMFVKVPNYSNIINFFKSNLSDIDKKSYELLENFMIKWNMTEKKYVSEKIFEDDRYFSDDFFENKNEIIEAYRYIKNLYQEYKPIFNIKNKPQEFSNHLNRFLQELDIKSKLETVVEEFKQEGRYETASEITQVYNILIDTLDKVNSVVDDYLIDISMYKKMLYQGLNSQKVAMIPPTVDSVIVMDVKRSKSLGSKVLLMLGMNDTLLPLVKSNDVLLSDSEKTALKSGGISINTTTTDNMNQEKTSLYMMISKIRDKIFFSFPMTDVNGLGSNKSMYLTDIGYIFPKIKHQYISSNDLKELSDETLDVAFEKMKNDFRDMIQNDSIDEEIIKKFKYFSKIEKYKDDMRIMQSAIFSENTIDKLPQEYVDVIYKKPIKSSISKIEKYVQCPFSYYMKYGINPQKRDSQSIDYLKSGIVMHKYMEEFSKEILQNNLILSLDTQEKVDSFVEKIYSQNILQEDTKLIVEDSKRQYSIINKLKKISKKATSIIIKQKTYNTFTTVETEKSISLKTSDVIYEGKVDRIDSLKIYNKEYIQVIDYKSGEKDINFEDVYNGINIQMLFYLYVLTMKNQEGKVPHGVLYFPMIDKNVLIEDEDMSMLQDKIDQTMKMRGLLTDEINLLKAFENDIDGKSKYVDVKFDGQKASGSVVSEEQMKKLLKKVLMIVRENQSEIMSGNIIAKPTDKACIYCDYKNICKFDESIKGYDYKKQVKFKSRDKKAEFFLKIEEEVTNE